MTEFIKKKTEKFNVQSIKSIEMCYVALAPARVDVDSLKEKIKASMKKKKVTKAK